MQSKTLRLRGNRPSRSDVYPLGEFPQELIHRISRGLIFYWAIGFTDISGNAWSSAFAEALGGTNHSSNLDMHDVSLKSCAWTLKTVQHKNPFTCRRVSLISGRNSPGYSQGIEEPLRDIQKTGRAVLEIWNGRVNRTLGNYDQFRRLVLVRNFNKLEFALFEDEITRFVPQNYEWSINKRNNLIGSNVATGEHCFTWARHGDKLTIICRVPASAKMFNIAPTEILTVDDVLRAVRYSPVSLNIMDRQEGS